MALLPNEGIAPGPPWRITVGSRFGTTAGAAVSASGPWPGGVLRSAVDAPPRPTRASRPRCTKVTSHDLTSRGRSVEPIGGVQDTRAGSHPVVVGPGVEGVHERQVPRDLRGRLLRP